MQDKRAGNYEIGAEIGRGSFATVYRGHHVVSSKILVFFQYDDLLCV